MTARSRRLALFASILAVFGIAAEARADLYKYRKPGGESLITNRARPELELVEVIQGTAPDRSDASGTSDASEQTRRPSGDRRARYDSLIRRAAETHDLPFSFVKAVIRVESDFQPQVTSSAGAMGLMQLMPETAASLDVENPYVPEANVFGGAKLLSRLVGRYDGNINLVLAAYNAGAGAVDRHGGIPYRKTRRYVASVYRWYRLYDDRHGGEE